MEICYYKKIMNRQVIHIQELPQTHLTLDIYRCKKCAGFNINCESYTPAQRQVQEHERRVRGLEVKV
jgi:hypothetical protein